MNRTSHLSELAHCKGTRMNPRLLALLFNSPYGSSSLLWKSRLACLSTLPLHAQPQVASCLDRPGVVIVFTAEKGICTKSVCVCVVARCPLLRAAMSGTSTIFYRLAFGIAAQILHTRNA
eukprot:4887997-Amphidinium_carterae.1